jgi:hypothetical protein
MIKEQAIKINRLNWSMRTPTKRKKQQSLISSQLNIKN